jgi:hypothetical protein
MRRNRRSAVRIPVPTSAASLAASAYVRAQRQRRAYTGPHAFLGIFRPARAVIGVERIDAADRWLSPAFNQSSVESSCAPSVKLIPSPQWR